MLEDEDYDIVETDEDDVIPWRGKLTKQRCDYICANLEKGNYLTTCARAVGISYETIRRWKKRGENGEEPYATFLERVEKAEAIGELRSMEVIDDVASRGNWLASAWKLERKYPQRFGKRERMDFGSDSDFKIEISSKKSPYKMADDEKKLLDADE